MYRVLIADDHAIVRSGLRQVLQDEAGIASIGEAGSGREVLAVLKEQAWDLLLLDINMPDRNGVDILRLARAQYPATRVLVLSGYPESQYAVNVLRAGASGFLSKNAPTEELVRAVMTVLSGRRYVSRDLAESLVAGLNSGEEKPPHEKLSTREFQILCKLAAGRSATEIGRELCISVKTVSTYRSRILEKMALKTNADLTAYALRRELLN
jgi:DNA-binding NarL/FixJ family response regulator